MTDKPISQRAMLGQIIQRQVEVLNEVRELTRQGAKRTEQIDRLVLFERRLLAHVERMVKAAETQAAIYARRGPFSSRSTDR
jgi:hypothetical protein